MLGLFILIGIIGAIGFIANIGEDGLMTIGCFILTIIATIGSIMVLEQKEEKPKVNITVEQRVAIETTGGKPDTLSVQYPQGASLNIDDYDSIPTLGWTLGDEHGGLHPYVRNFHTLSMPVVLNK